MANDGYFVIQCAKKGFKEFKTNDLDDEVNRWDSRIEFAKRFGISSLEELVRWVDTKPRIFYIWFILDGKSMTLGRYKNSLEYGSKRKKLTKLRMKNGKTTD